MKIYTGTTYTIFGDCWEDSENMTPFDLTNSKIICNIKRAGSGNTVYSLPVNIVGNEYSAVCPCELNTHSGNLIAVFKIFITGSKCAIKEQTQPFTVHSI